MIRTPEDGLLDVYKTLLLKKVKKMLLKSFSKPKNYAKTVYFLSLLPFDR